MKSYSKEQEIRKVNVRNRAEDEAKRGRRVKANLKKWDQMEDEDFEEE
jgi:hypothetical protein